MSWIQIRATTTPVDAEQLSEWLSEQGAAAVTYMDEQDDPIYEPKLGTTELWANTVVMGLFHADVDPRPIVAQMQQLPLTLRQFKSEILEDKDWEREWMDNFKPMRFGNRLWICPSWHEQPDPTAVNVLLDPGLAFGTGTHPTTALCLRWLDGQDLQGKTIIDFGCGSGILAIAALKLGAARAIGIDIDPQALTASMDNAQRNQVADRLTLLLPEQVSDEHVGDVLVANILAGPLDELAPTIMQRIADDSPFALSGILAEQGERLLSRYGQFASMDEPAIQDEWLRLSGKKLGK